MKKKGFILIAVVLAIATIAYAGERKERDDIHYTGTITYDNQPTLSTSASAWNVGSGAEADIKTLYDGNSKDFRTGIDDSADDFEIGLGGTFETTERITISGHATNTVITFGDGGAGDQQVVFDGSAQDYYIGVDEAGYTDDLVFGKGAVVGTTPAFAIDENVVTTWVGGTNKLTEVVAATNVLTVAECGKTSFLNHATEFVSTLPAISTVAAGCEFTFIVTAAADTGSYTVITGNSKETKIQGFLNMGADAPDACANEDTIIFVTGDAVGDWAKVIFDGSNWILSGSALTDNKLTCTDEA